MIMYLKVTRVCITKYKINFCSFLSDLHILQLGYLALTFEEAPKKRVKN